MKTYRRTVTAQAVQITDSTFDAPHPNPEHVIGVTYYPKEREAVVPFDGYGETLTAKLGDWIVHPEDEEYPHILCDEAFRLMWTPEPESAPREPKDRFAVTAAEVRACREGRLLDAVRSYRNRSGLGLIESRRIVEAAAKETP